MEIDFNWGRILVNRYEETEVHLAFSFSRTQLNLFDSRWEIWYSYKRNSNTWCVLCIWGSVSCRRRTLKWSVKIFKGRPGSEWRQVKLLFIPKGNGLFVFQRSGALKLWICEACPAQLIQEGRAIVKEGKTKHVKVGGVQPPSLTIRIAHIYRNMSIRDLSEQRRWSDGSPKTPICPFLKLTAGVSFQSLRRPA